MPGIDDRVGDEAHVPRRHRRVRTRPICSRRPSFRRRLCTFLGILGGLEGRLGGLDEVGWWQGWLGYGEDERWCGCLGFYIGRVSK